MHQNLICPDAPDKIGQNIPHKGLAPRSALCYFLDEA